MQRICFIPFDGANQHEFVTSSNQWNSEGVNLKNPKTFTLIGYDHNVHNELLTLSSDSTIYIRGHGSQGGTEFSTNMHVGEEVQKAQSLTIEDVCQRLIDSGLQKSFAGKIKFSNCWSGVSDPYRKGRETPSALRGAKYFRKQGFKKCHVFGYMGPFGDEIGPPENPDINIIDDSMKDGHDHKNVMVPSTTGGKPTIMRASKAREEFLKPKKSLLDRAVEFFKPGTDSA
jgi:hypothetical protein